MVQVGETVLKFDGHPDRTLGVWLFKNVSNCMSLQEQVVAQTINPELALLDATMVPDLWVLQLAGFKALSAEAQGARRTRSLHAELVVDVSASRHIKESLSRFGISRQTRHLLVGRFDPAAGDADYVRSVIQGEEVSVDELATLTNTALLEKYFKTTALEMKVGSLTDAICCRIARATADFLFE